MDLELERPLPEPTQAEPGSLEKIAILRHRWEAGLEMHHPCDRRHEHARNQPIRYRADGVNLKYELRDFIDTLHWLNGEDGSFENAVRLYEG